MKLNRIRIKLALLLLAIGLVPAGAVYFAFAATEGEVRQNALTSYERLAVSLGDVVDRNLFERYGDVQAFGLNGEAHKPENWRNPGTDNPLLAAIDGYMVTYGLYRLMLLVDPQGQVLAVNSVDGKGKPLDTAGLYEQNFADASWFKAALSGQFLDGRNGLTGTAVEQPGRNEIVAGLYGDDGFVIPFSAPVKNRAGETIGVWANFADFALVEEIFFEIYAGLQHQGMGSAELTLLDPTGVVLVDYDPTLQGSGDYVRNPDVIGKLNLAEKGVQSARDAVSGKTGGVDSLHARKQVWQASGFAYLDGAYDYPGLGWSVLVRIPVGEAYATLNETSLLMQIVIVVAAAVVILLGVVVGGFAARPIQRLTGTMTSLARGDDSVEVSARQRGDEIGDMARAVQVFKDNAIEMKRMRAEQAAAEARAVEEKKAAMHQLADSFQASVGGIVQIVSSASTEMQATAQSMSSTAEQTSRQAAAVAASSEEASSNVQTVAAAAEELSSSVVEIGRQVASSAEIAGRAVSEAERTNATVRGLADASQKIGAVVSLIHEIASQTNLLALNATIEAARAGEAGKGFAVVASEVKSLANQTAKATEEISQQIASIQSATGDAVAAIDAIGATIGQISEIATAIASAVEEQGAATQEIARNVQQAALGTQGVSANIGGVTEAAGATGAAASQVLSAAGELSQQAEALQVQVDRFLAEVRAA